MHDNVTEDGIDGIENEVTQLPDASTGKVSSTKFGGMSNQLAARPATRRRGDAEQFPDAVTVFDVAVTPWFSHDRRMPWDRELDLSCCGYERKFWKAIVRLTQSEREACVGPSEQGSQTVAVPN